MREIFSFFILILLSGCGGGSSNNFTSPYTNSSFKKVLEQSSLQWQSSDLNSTPVSIRELKNYASKNLFLSQDKYLNIQTQDSGNRRVELRQKDEWRLDQTRGVHARLICEVPKAINEYTWMQIYGKNLNAPLLRLVWKRSRYKVKNHLWAILKNPNPTKQSIVIDLGLNPSKLFSVDLKVENSVLTIQINSKTKYTQDVRYWGDDKYYFKTGVYLSGTANEKINSNENRAGVRYDILRYY